MSKVRSGGGKKRPQRTPQRTGAAKAASRPAQPPAPERPTLVVLVDGVALPEAEARDLWTKFSQHMDAHEGDMAGFARESGFASVKPEYRRGQAVLVIQRG